MFMIQRFNKTTRIKGFRMEMSGLGPMPVMPIAGVGSATVAPASITEATQHTPAGESMGSSESITDLVMLALIHAMVTDEDDESKMDPILSAIIASIIFGEDKAQGATPQEMAQMIGDILSSGEPGSYTKAMGISGGGAGSGLTYGQGGTVGMSAPIGGMVSTGA